MGTQEQELMFISRERQSSLKKKKNGELYYLGKF